MRRLSKQNSTESNYLKCFGCSLILWFLCVLIFIARNKEDIQSNNSPFTQTKIASSEFTENGWKNIYIHVQSARMSVQEMDYLLEKYWYPHLKHQTIENIKDIDFKSQQQKITKKNKKIIDDKNADNNKLRSAPSTTSKSKSDIPYPSDWSSPCFPQKMNDKKCILQHMEYWKKGILSHQNEENFQKPKISHKYVTFLKDCGGFNNIRQGFEFHAMVAWLTNRTLVLPPDVPWYLIDNGQMTRGRSKKNEKFKAWPDGKERAFGVSNYDIWFDLDDLSLAVPVITSAHFIQREFDSLNIPFEFKDGDIVNLDRQKGSKYLTWLNDKAEALHCNLPWGQLANLLYWPSIKEVENKNAVQINDAFVDNRIKREYTNHLKQAPFIHFPSCKKGNPRSDHDFRYLGQIARSIAFDSKESDILYKQILRDHVHLKSEIMEYAAMVIEILGLFNFASFHIRRNELQYKYVFAKALDSYNNVRPLIGDNEVLYIATDESEADYFKVFEENGRRKVYRWKDFFGSEAQFEKTKNVQIPGKLHGEVEMAICAMGRIFFGTKESTFSAYIGILRGYFGAPYTQTLYHHYPLTKDVDESSKISKSNPGKPYRGQIYKIPFPDLWENVP